MKLVYDFVTNRRNRGKNVAFLALRKNSHSQEYSQKILTSRRQPDPSRLYTQKYFSRLCPSRLEPSFFPRRRVTSRNQITGVRPAAVYVCRAERGR